MNRWSKAKDGYMFVLTLYGFSINSVRAKFNQLNKKYGTYKYRVPTSWIRNEYVREVKEVGEE